MSTNISSHGYINMIFTKDASIEIEGKSKIEIKKTAGARIYALVSEEEIRKYGIPIIKTIAKRQIDKTNTLFLSKEEKSSEEINQKTMKIHIRSDKPSTVTEATSKLVTGLRPTPPLSTAPIGQQQIAATKMKRIPVKKQWIAKFEQLSKEREELTSKISKKEYDAISANNAVGHSKYRIGGSIPESDIRKRIVINDKKRTNPGDLTYGKGCWDDANARVKSQISAAGSSTISEQITITEETLERTFTDANEPNSYAAKLTENGGQIDAGVIAHDMEHILGLEKEDQKVPPKLSALPHITEKQKTKIDAFIMRTVENEIDHVAKTGKIIPEGEFDQVTALKNISFKLLQQLRKAQPDIPSELLLQTVRNSARLMMYQTHFDRGHFSGSSHSIKHIMHNIALAEGLSQKIEQEGHCNEMDKVLILLVHIHHDIGYTVPNAQHAKDWFIAAKDHPFHGGAFIRDNQKIYTELLGREGYDTFLKSVYMHSYMNTGFSITESGKGAFVHHPGIVRSVTSCSDCCAVTSDIKLQEFWMRPECIKIGTRLVLYQNQFAERCAAKLLQKYNEGNDLEFIAAIDAKRGDNTAEKFFKDTASKELAALFRSPSNIKDSQSIEDLANSYDPNNLLVKEDVKEALEFYREIKNLLKVEAGVTAAEMSDAIVKRYEKETGIPLSPEQKEKIKTQDIQRLEQAIDYNFNLQSITGAINQYGAYFIDLKAKKTKDTSAAPYELQATFAPSQAQGHLEQTCKAGYEAWKKFAEEMKFDTNNFSELFQSYMAYVNGVKQQLSEDELADLHEEFQIKFQTFNSLATNQHVMVLKEGVILLQTEKGRMVINTNEEVDTDEVGKTFEAINNAMKDKTLVPIVEYMAAELIAKAETIDDVERLRNAVIQIMSKTINELTDYSQEHMIDNFTVLQEALLNTLNNKKEFKANIVEFSNTILTSSRYIYEGSLSSVS